MLDPSTATLHMDMLNVPKERCPTDNSTVFFYLEAGISYRCRHCKHVHVVTWEEVMQKYQEVQQRKPCIQ